MIAFVENKLPDFDFVETTLKASRDDNRWTNFGPVSRRLEATVHAFLELPDELSVVAAASGTAALHGLVGLHDFVAGRPLRWVVSAYTFVCQRQGPLAGSLVVDCGADGFLDPAAVAAVPASDYDGILVTNLFGGTTDVERWAGFARERGKRLLIDSAAGMSPRGGERPRAVGEGEAFSFHHTKPLGVGEGGCAVVPAELADTYRSLLNFGRYAGIDTGRHSFNGKLSDVAAAFILDRLRAEPEIRAAHRDQWQRIVSIAATLGYEVVGDGAPDLPALVALAGPRPIPPGALANGDVALHKLYRPLAAGMPVAASIYDRVVCWPCHPDVAGLADEAIERTLARLASPG